MSCTYLIIKIKKVNGSFNQCKSYKNTQLTWKSVAVCTWGLNITTGFRHELAQYAAAGVAHSASCQWKMQLHAITIAAMFSHVYTIQSAHKSLSRKAHMLLERSCISAQRGERKGLTQVSAQMYKFIVAQWSVSLIAYNSHPCTIILRPWRYWWRRPRAVSYGNLSRTRGSSPISIICISRRRCAFIAPG